MEATGVSGPHGGAQFEAIVKDVVRASAKARKAERGSGNPRAPWPSGDTGRRFLVTWVKSIKTADGATVPARVPPGAEPQPDGSFLVPDDRPWRRAIRDGFAAKIPKA